MNEAKGSNLVIDPVCGMSIDPATAVGSSAYGGKTYYFCNRGCEAKFDADPKKYTSTNAEPAMGGSCCSTRKS